MEKVTTDTIISWLSSQIAEKLPVDLHTHMDACQKLSVLVGSEQEKLFDLQQEVARLKVTLIEDGKSVSESKTRVEATDEYKEMLKQKAKVEQVFEMIKITKLHSRLAREEQGSQF